MARKFYLNDSEGIFYPVAHAGATYDSDGNTIEQRINELDENIELALSLFNYNTAEPTSGFASRTVWIS